MAVTVAAVCLPNPALAGIPPLPPKNLQGSYDSGAHTVHLTWDAPDSGTYTYAVYRDGTMLDSHVTDLQYTDTAPYKVGAYRVYATDSSSQGSAAAVAIVICPPIAFQDTPPFIVPQWDCLPV